MTSALLLFAQAEDAGSRSLVELAGNLAADGLLWATLLGVLGIWLMLPRGEARGRRLGIVFALVSLGLLGWQVPRIGAWAVDAVFLILAAVTVISALATITARNPVNSAVWFAVVLLGTAGLFLVTGAEFLGVATVVVYAGAILVTFLFVLMLAQPAGHAFYDRLSWDAFLSAATGGVLICMLAIKIAGGVESQAEPGEVDSAIAEARQQQLNENILADQHVAHFGAQLFSRHLIAVEVAGVLLLAALVGAVAIVAQGKKLPAPARAEQGRAEHA